MATENEHGKLIAAAARAALNPLGLVRKGRSRIWWSDERYWTISVEFQPSGWSKGSYLNICPLLLWHSTGSRYLYRAADFISFESAAQFTPLIAEMAKFATSEVLLWRQRYRSLPEVARYLTSRPLGEGGPVLDAAVACALADDIAAARALFRRLAAWPTADYGWQSQVRADGAEIAALLDHPDQFRHRIADLIQHRRRLRGLADVPHGLDNAIQASVYHHPAE